MKKIRLEIELEYDSDIVHGDDPEGVKWFRECILELVLGELNLVSDEVGDSIGTVKVIRELEVK